MIPREHSTYLQSVTDSLAGHHLHACSPGDTPQNDSTSADEAELLRSVWEKVGIVSPPEPEEAIMERIYHQVISRAVSEEIDDDELDWVVGARTSPEIDPDDINK